LLRFAGFPSTSSSSLSSAFFFLFAAAAFPAVLLADVGLLLSRALGGKLDVGVGACEGVVCADEGVDSCYASQQNPYA